MIEGSARWFAIVTLLCWGCAEGETKDAAIGTDAGICADAGNCTDARNSTDAGMCTEPGYRPALGPAGAGQGVQTIEAVRAIPIAAPEVATACSRSEISDQCGCEDLACATGEVCVLTPVPTSGRPAQANRCYRVCASDMDCAVDELCIPAYGHNPLTGDMTNPAPVCKKVGCRSGDECCSGRCMAWTYYESQGTPSAFWGITCE